MSHRHEATLCSFNKEYELALGEFTLDESKLLGSGQFGDVFIGELRKSNHSGLPVAIKTTKSCKRPIDTDYFKALLDEIKVMCYIGNHPNIVSLIGVCTAEIQTRHLWIVLELCENGSLLNYLTINKNFFEKYSPESHSARSDYMRLNSWKNPATAGELISTQDLLQWAHEISIGMNFLAQKKVCHGDLALRNILLTGNRVAKISDFGLARKLYNYVLYARDEETALPWRWMSPESLRNLTFSQRTDVWAYGVTLWEIFSLGESPWLTSEYGPEFITSLIQGLRLNRPAACPTQVYQIMEGCWHVQDHLRPTFSQLVIYLEKSRSGICGRIDEDEQEQS